MRTRQQAFVAGDPEPPMNDGNRLAEAIIKDRKAREDDAVGETVVATFPEMVFQPKQYNSFRVGGFVAETTVRDGETRVDALHRASRDLERFADEDFDRKLAQFLSMYGRMVDKLEGK